MRPLGRGLVELARAPAATAIALAGTLAAALAARATWLRAAEALAADRLARALLIGLVGSALAALLADATRAIALVAYAGPPRPLSRTLALGLSRTPAMITVRAVELLLYFALGIGELFVLLRVLPHLGGAARQALFAAVCLLPAGGLALVTFAACRIAQTLIARGLRPAAALAHGYDLTLRRVPTLTRLGLVALLVAAPFWIIALVAPAPLGALAVAVPALWLYAALTLLVGRDPRLALG